MVDSSWECESWQKGVFAYLFICLSEVSGESFVNVLNLYQSIMLCTPSLRVVEYKEADDA